MERNALAKERTQLAAERTFLSWIRTGLTSVGIGIAVARFVIFHNVFHQNLAHFIGQLLILWGIGIFVFALFSYRRTRQQIIGAFIWKEFAGLTIATIILILLCFFLFLIVVE